MINCYFEFPAYLFEVLKTADSIKSIFDLFNKLFEKFQIGKMQKSKIIQITLKIKGVDL
jgi:hypothetical protein